MDALLSVGSGALVILGLGVLLAAISHANYDTHRQKVGFLQLLQTPDFQLVIDWGLILLELGILGSSSSVWVRALFGLFAVLFAIHAVRTRRKLLARNHLDSLSVHF